MLLREIPVEEIRVNDDDFYLRYTPTSIRKLSKSLAAIGQLVPIRVRASKNGEKPYDLVYGQRRVLAARNLGWKTVMADVVTLDENELFTQSVVENLQRQDLSDFEKALVFQRMNKEFGKTYEEIGESVGCSRQHISNIIAMLRLFDAEYLSQNPDILEALQKISEHHSRVLSRIQDENERGNLLKIVARDELTVKELTRVVTRLRSWFEATDSNVTVKDLALRRQRSADQSEIKKVIFRKFQYARLGDWSDVMRSDLFDKEFTLYSLFPPFDMKQGFHAIRKLRHYFEKISPNLTCKIDNLKVRFVDTFAMVTLTACYEGTFTGTSINLRARGTMILIKRKDKWRIFHEHWSNLDAPFDYGTQLNSQSVHASLS
ncbi:MAG: ParB/RepB/Spo0J family partition protein [archaeon]|nr:ParB/RepB/Spo0J family partition protein [archaeon]